MTAPMRLVIADDQPAVRSALRLLIDQEPDAEVIAEAASATGLLRKVGTLQFDVLLLDWELPGLSAEQLVRLVLFEQPKVRIVAMSSRPEAVEEAIAVGVTSFIGKEYSARRTQDILRGLWDQTTAEK